MAREDERLYDALVEAIADQRLGPGTRLAEVEVAETYGSTRRHVERALLRLETDGLVTRRRHAGVAVATPSAEEARGLFRTRRMIEGAVVRELALEATRATLMPLRINLRAEADARERARPAKRCASRAPSTCCWRRRPAVPRSWRWCGAWW